MRGNEGFPTAVASQRAAAKKGCREDDLEVH